MSVPRPVGGHLEPRAALRPIDGGAPGPAGIGMVEPDAVDGDAPLRVGLGCRRGVRGRNSPASGCQIEDAAAVTSVPFVRGK